MGNAPSTSSLRDLFVESRDVWTRIVHALPAGAAITAHKTIGMELPIAPLPWRTVMTHMNACMLCPQMNTHCRQVYISHCVGWIVCPSCYPRALMGALYHRQHVSHSVSTHILFPREDSRAFKMNDRSLQVRFYRLRNRAVQEGWLAPWLHLDVMCVAHGAATLVCHFTSTGAPAPRAAMCDLCRGVSVRNLVAYNPVAMRPIVEEMCARLRASDDYEADIRLRWAALVRDEAIQGLALHEAFRHLRTALFPDAVHRILAPLVFHV